LWKSEQNGFVLKIHAKNFCESAQNGQRFSKFCSQNAGNAISEIPLKARVFDAQLVASPLVLVSLRIYTENTPLTAKCVHVKIPYFNAWVVKYEYRSTLSGVGG
jgi:hypothetical protein